MDYLDEKIITILKGDGRASNAGIAREVGVSEGTVRRRLKRLVKEDYIQIVAIPDATKLGFESQALIGIQVQPDKIEEVANRLSDLSEVNWVAMTTGTFDIFAWATLRTAEALGVFLRHQIGTIDGVRRSETFVNLDNTRGQSASI